MGTTRLHIALLCGGRSTEHAISVSSSVNIASVLNDSDRYALSIIYIAENGFWYLMEDVEAFLANSPQKLISEGKACPIALLPGNSKMPWLALDASGKRYVADCVFIALHGTQGEDGSPQGLLQMLGIPYVGSDLLSSAICMDKSVTKTVLEAAGISVVDWRLIDQDDARLSYDNLKQQFGKTLFIKPTTLGSSVGVAKVSDSDAFQRAIDYAFSYDNRIIIEPAIFGREIECPVLGNDKIQTAWPAEIIYHDNTFYSYDRKYKNSSAVTIQVPAALSQKLAKKIRHTAIQAYKILGCSGMARVDFFIDNQDAILINEVNTIPGFTDNSLYPKAFQKSGLSTSDLLDQLIQLALKRYQGNQVLRRIYKTV